jgi:glycerophosphoryl diester phosphodiesterase
MDRVPTNTYIQKLHDMGVSNIHIEKDNIYMDQENNCEFREAVRRRGMNIWVWTVNTKEIFDDMVAYGADAIFTDHPELFR